jgi:hypothetical protein
MDAPIDFQIPDEILSSPMPSPSFHFDWDIPRTSDFDFPTSIDLFDLPSSDPFADFNLPISDPFADFNFETSVIPRPQSPLPPAPAKPIRPMPVKTTPAIFRPFVSVHTAEIAVNELRQYFADKEAGPRNPLPTVQGVRRELCA